MVAELTLGVLVSQRKRGARSLLCPHASHARQQCYTVSDDHPYCRECSPPLSSTEPGTLTPRRSSCLPSPLFSPLLASQCYMNGVLSTFVSLLILFRSLDGSSALVQRVQEILPWLPLPPAVSLRGNEATLVQKPSPVDKEKEESLSVRYEGTAEHPPVMVEFGKEELVLGDGNKEEEEDEKDWPRRGSGTSTLV